MTPHNISTRSAGLTVMRGACFEARVLGRGPLVLGQDCNSAGLTCRLGKPMLLILHTVSHAIV